MNLTDDKIHSGSFMCSVECGVMYTEEWFMCLDYAVEFKELVFLGN